MKRYLWDDRYGWSKIKEFSGPQNLNWLRWWKVMWLVSWRVQAAFLGNCNLNIMKLVSRCWVNGRRTTGRGQWRSDRGDSGICIPIVRMNAPFLQQCSSTALTQFTFSPFFSKALSQECKTLSTFAFHCVLLAGFITKISLGPYIQGLTSQRWGGKKGSNIFTTDTIR